MEIIGDMLRQGDDGMWFIDYVATFQEQLGDPEMYLSFLRRHRDVILSGAKNHAQLNSILSKFIWMANYHNQIVANLHDEVFEKYDFYKDDFIITSKEIPALQYMKP